MSTLPFKFVLFQPTVDLKEEDGFKRGPPGVWGKGGGGGVGRPFGRPSRPSEGEKRLIWRSKPGNWIALPGFEVKAEKIYNFPLR